MRWQASITHKKILRVTVFWHDFAWKYSEDCFSKIPISRTKLSTTLVNRGCVPAVPSYPKPGARLAHSGQSLFGMLVFPHTAIALSPFQAISFLDMVTLRLKPETVMALPSRREKIQASTRVPTVPSCRMYINECAQFTAGMQGRYHEHRSAALQCLRWARGIIINS